MYKILSVFFVFIAMGLAVDQVLMITKGYVVKRKNSPVVTIKSANSTTNITWNKDVSAKNNAFRATYEFTYLSQNKTLRASSANLCVLAKKGSFEEVCQTYFLNILTKSKSCPIKKGTKKTFRLPYFYRYSGDKSAGCGKIKGVFKLFEKSEKSDKNPVIIHGLRGSKIVC